jgi:hypothetical protein
MNLQDCIPYQCGFDPLNMAARYACAAAGFPGVRSCLDPLCKPWCPNASVEPAVARAATAIHYPPVLTPQNLVRPVPAITEALRPIPVDTAEGWCGLNRAISDHPVIAGGILLLTFAVVRMARGR